MVSRAWDPKTKGANFLSQNGTKKNRNPTKIETQAKSKPKTLSESKNKANSKKNRRFLKRQKAAENFWDFLTFLKLFSKRDRQNPEPQILNPEP